MITVPCTETDYDEAEVVKKGDSFVYSLKILGEDQLK